MVLFEAEIIRVAVPDMGNDHTVLFFSPAQKFGYVSLLKLTLLLLSRNKFWELS